MARLTYYACHAIQADIRDVMASDGQDTPRKPWQLPPGSINFGVVMNLAFVGSLVYALGAVAGTFPGDTFQVIAAFVLAASSGFLSFLFWLALLLSRKGYRTLREFRQRPRRS